jgi:DNA processing protein
VADSRERQAWIALASTPGVGDETTARVLARFGSAREVLAGVADGRVDAWSAEVRTSEGRPPITGKALSELRRTASDPAARLRDMEQMRLSTTTALDADYPRRLRDLDPPPAVINVLGDAQILARPRLVAVVGTRRPTPGGRLLATRVVRRLVECGAVIVSGLAVGIDGAAHAATIEAGGRTVAVIGGGHRHPGVRAHERLRAEIIATGGAIISEHHPDAVPRLGTFPRRNRIIAALGDATIVIEAPRRSGALITANRALGLERPVFVAPGRVGDWATAGALALLRETPARPLVGLDELIEDLGYFAAEPESVEDVSRTGQRGVAPALAMLGETERTVARRLVAGPTGLDSLVADTGLAPAVVSSAVTMLLMRGWVEPVGPAYVVAGPLAR